MSGLASAGPKDNGNRRISGVAFAAWIKSKNQRKRASSGESADGRAVVRCVNLAPSARALPGDPDVKPTYTHP